MNGDEEGRRRMEWMLADPVGYFAHARKVALAEAREAIKSRARAECVCEEPCRYCKCEQP